MEMSFFFVLSVTKLNKIMQNDRSTGFHLFEF